MRQTTQAAPHQFQERSMTESELTRAQRDALYRIRQLHSSTIPDGDKFHVRRISDIGRGAVIVFGHQGKGDEPRWFDNNYAFTIGPRGGATMIEGPTSMAYYQGKRWCGINIKIR